MNFDLPDTNKKINDVISQSRSSTIRCKINSLIEQSKTKTGNSDIEKEKLDGSKKEPIEKQKIDDLIRQFNKNEIAAVITTYDDIQYDENGNYIKAKEISKINLVPRGDNFIVKKE